METRPGQQNTLPNGEPGALPALSQQGMWSAWAALASICVGIQRVVNLKCTLILGFHLPFSSWQNLLYLSSRDVEAFFEER